MRTIIKTVFIGSAMLLVIAAGCSKKSTNSVSNDSTANTTATATVTTTSSGFSPATVTVNAGDTVTFVNNGTGTNWPASDPHPTHTGLPGFDALRGLKTGQSYSYTFTKIGTFGYHDHLNSSLTGTVVVQ